MKDRLTICKQHPRGNEDKDDDCLSKWHLSHRGTIKYINPIFRRKNLIHREKRVEHLAKVDRRIVSKVTAKKLHGNEGCNVVDNDEEERHICETIHISKNSELLNL